MNSEITFVRQDILDSLGAIKFALGKPDSVLPILKCFCFDGKRVTAYNDLIAASIPCEFPVAIAVEGKLLLDWLKRVKGNEVKVTALTGAQDIKFSCGRSSISVPCFDQDKFMHSIPTVGHFETDAALLRFGAHSVQSCMGDDPAQHYGVTVDFTGNEAVFYAHADQVASRQYVDMRAGSEVAERLPPEFVEKLPAGDGKVVFSEEGVTVMYDDHLHLFCRTKRSKDVDQFVNLFDTVADVPDDKFSPIPEGLVDAVYALQLVAERGDGNIKFECAAGKLRVSSTDSMSLMGKHSFDGATMPDFSATVMAASILKVLPGCEWLHVGDGVILTANEDYTGVCTFG